MSLKRIKDDLRQLPYTEMKALSQQLSDSLSGMMEEMGEGDWPPIIAEALVALPQEDHQSLENESIFLARAFTKPKKGKVTIELKTDASGAWSAKAGEFAHVAPDVRSAISELLDQIAAYEALWGKKS